MQFVYKTDLELANELIFGTVSQTIEPCSRPRSDEELVIASKNGESCALGELLVRHQKMMFCVARRYTESTDEAHDLVQETMLRATRYFGQFRGESRFTTWLNSIVIHTAISDIRRERHIRWVNLDEQEEEETRFCLRSLQDARRNPEEDYSHRETRHLLQREAMKLPPQYRFILTACDLDGYSIKDVAQALGLHLGAAKSRLRRARWCLSAAMEKSGATRPRVRTDRQAAGAKRGVHLAGERMRASLATSPSAKRSE